MLSFIKKIYFQMDHENDNRISHYPLMDTNGLKIIIVSMCYLIFVKALGPKFMKNRRPYELKRSMQIYNATQVILNLSLTIYIAYYVMTDLKFDFICAMPDYSRTERGYTEAQICYYYYLLKVLDLMDTIFITLRKRYRQASILHVYHHMVMCISVQILTQHYPGGSYLIPFMLNCFVHVIMYSYYLLTSISTKLKDSLWWKRHITHIQMVQFLYNILRFIHIGFNSNCNYSKFWTWFGFSQNVIFFILFSNFYVRNYILKKKEKSN